MGRLSLRYLFDQQWFYADFMIQYSVMRTFREMVTGFRIFGGDIAGYCRILPDIAGTLII